MFTAVSLILGCSSTEPDEFLQKGAEILTDYIIQLRKFLRKYPWPQTNTDHAGGDLGEELPAIEESHTWEKLTPEVKMSNPSLTVPMKNF